MDCREFRKQHFAYLDDTLPGDEMAVAQQHIMKCDGCAAHDTMVRRSLMLVRNMSAIEPSANFRQRMQERLDEARCEHQRERFRLAELENNPQPRVLRQPVMFSAVAVGVLVVGTMVWQQKSPAPVSEVSAMATQPTPVTKAVFDTTQQPIYVSPAMLQAMATGNPMWPAAIMVDDAPAQMVNNGFTQVKLARE